MAPVATNDKAPETQTQTIADLKAQIRVQRFINPFNTAEDDDGDKDYEFEHLKATYPDANWVPLGDMEVTERALFADPEKKALLSAAKKVTYLSPAIGVELEGIDLRHLSDAQKDELALLIAERGVVFFRNQDINPHEQLALGRHFGPLHKHVAAGVPKDPSLEELLIVYTDKTKRPDPAAYSKIDLWHSDVTYEKQPPGVTSLKGITIPDVGGDTLWTSGYALYSSLSPEMQKYLEGLSAVHSAVPQANEARAQGRPVRRPEIETVHPIVRVHPATGWKSIYVNPAFTNRILGVPKAESETILKLLYQQMAHNPDFQVRFKWEKNSLAMWDNRIVHHTAIFDYWPAKRHALRVTPHAEKPLSVAEYEKATGKVAKDRQIEIWKSQGLESVRATKSNGSGPKGYND